jgi:hypothetical protein
MFYSLQGTVLFFLELGCSQTMKAMKADEVVGLARAAVNAPQTKRFAQSGNGQPVAKRLDCGSFSTAFVRMAYCLSKA